VLDNNNQADYVFMKNIKNQHNRNLIYRLLYANESNKSGNDYDSIVQRVNDLEAFVMPNESMPTCSML